MSIYVCTIYIYICQKFLSCSLILNKLTELCINYILIKLFFIKLLLTITNAG